MDSANRASNSGGVRRRGHQSSGGKSSSTFGEGGLRIATDDHPGIYVYIIYLFLLFLNRGPQSVLILCLGFIGVVILLHIIGKMRS